MSNASRASARALFPSLTRIDRDLVPMLIVVPRETEAHRQPFPTTLYAHGYGSLNLEAIVFAGLVASHGVAPVSIAAQVSPPTSVPAASSNQPMSDKLSNFNTPKQSPSTSSAMLRAAGW